MKEQDWIDEVLESTTGIKKAEASPFLFEKIANRIERSKETVIRPGLKWALAVSVIVLITVNLFSVIKISKVETGKAEMISGNEYDHSTNYNY